MGEPLGNVKVYANGDWHPMPMTTADAARLIRERDEARAEVERILGLLEDVNDEAGRLRAENADLWLVADGWGVDDPSRESFEAWKRTHPGE